MRPPFTCGYRTPGVYVCERPVIFGKPLEHFIPCPPAYVDMAAIGLSATGMRIIERQDPQGAGTGIWDLWDYVSSADVIHSDNPWPTDFLEQTRSLGTSRKMSPSLLRDPNLRNLRRTGDNATTSRHIYVHARAIIENPALFYEARTGIKRCPAHWPEHDNDESTWEMCAALWWEMVGTYAIPRRHKVRLPRDWEKYGAPSCSYTADHMPEGAAPRFLHGVILSIPLQRIEIPRDDSGENQHERLEEKVKQSGWNYDFEVVED